MSEGKSSSGNGLGLLSVVFLIFMVLKLTGHIDWSWWWVTAPLWGGAAIVAVVVFFYVVFLVFASLVRK